MKIAQSKIIRFTIFMTMMNLSISQDTPQTLTKNASRDTEEVEPRVAAKPPTPVNCDVKLQQQKNELKDKCLEEKQTALQKQQTALEQEKEEMRQTFNNELLGMQQYYEGEKQTALEAQLLQEKQQKQLLAEKQTALEEQQKALLAEKETALEAQQKGLLAEKETALEEQQKGLLAEKETALEAIYCKAFSELKRYYNVFRVFVGHVEDVYDVDDDVRFVSSEYGFDEDFFFEVSSEKLKQDFKTKFGIDDTIQCPELQGRSLSSDENKDEQSNIQQDL